MKRLLKQIGMILAALVVFVAVILLMTFAINGPMRILTSEELALEQTRVMLDNYMKQTEVAGTSTAGLYLTLGVPFPTETPFVVPTSGSLGRPIISTPAPAGTAGDGELTGPGLRTQPARTATTALTEQQTLTPTQPTLTPAVTASPNATATQAARWSGQWTAWFDGEFEDIQSGMLTVTVNGSSLSGAAQFPGGAMTLTGEITDEGTQIYGEYTFAGETGEFFWELVEEGQEFLGNADNLRGLCAVRLGQTQSQGCALFFE